jgi:hypothetical protein
MAKREKNPSALASGRLGRKGEERGEDARDSGKGQTGRSPAEGE